MSNNFLQCMKHQSSLGSLKNSGELENMLASVLSVMREARLSLHIHVNQQPPSPQRRQGPSLVFDVVQDEKQHAKVPVQL